MGFLLLFHLATSYVQIGLTAVLPPNCLVVTFAPRHLPYGYDYEGKR